MSASTEQRAFLLERQATWEAYHNHKEGMAYAGLALWVGAAGAALVATDWPPTWVTGRPHGSVEYLVAISGVWALMLTFLRWQLTRRRWAAIQVAGLERYLARLAWPDRPRINVPVDKREFWGAKFLWALAGLPRTMKVVADVCDNVYPEDLREEWEYQRGEGTGATDHEHLVFAAGWTLFVLLVFRTGGLWWQSGLWVIGTAVLSLIAGYLLELR